jgi:hypothetical protein
MTKDCPNHARTTGNIINADGPLMRVNRPSTSTVPHEHIGAHGTGNQVRHTTDESHTRFPQLTDGPHPSITASNADSHSPGLHASSTNNNLGNQQLNNSVIHSDVPNAAVSRDMDDSVSIASEILGTPSIDAYEGGDEEDGGSDNMEPSMANDNEYPNIPENGSEFSTTQENDTWTTPSTQIPPNLPRKENLDSESPSPIDPVTFAVPVTKRIGDPSF